MDKTIQNFFADILSDAPVVVANNANQGANNANKEKVKPAEAVSKPIIQKKVNPKLAAYVAGELQRGILRADIKKGLITAGWPEKEVDAALNS